MKSKPIIGALGSLVFIVAFAQSVTPLPANVIADQATAKADMTTVQSDSTRLQSDQIQLLADKAASNAAGISTDKATIASGAKVLIDD